MADRAVCWYVVLCGGVGTMADRGFTESHERAGLIAGIAFILLLILCAAIMVTIFAGLY